MRDTCECVDIYVRNGYTTLSNPCKCIVQLNKFRYNIISYNLFFCIASLYESCLNNVTFEY